jgi:hypothetical protein
VGLITNGIDPLALAAGEQADQPQFEESSGRLLRHSATAVAENPYAYLPPSIPPRNGRPHLIKILERLARIEADNTLSLVEWAAKATTHLSWGVTILVVTPKGSEAVCQTLHRLLRVGFNPVLITVEPDFHFGNVKDRSRRLGFEAYQVATLAELNHWRQPERVIV